ncbi:MAG: hypothetical protein DYG98_23905 [Haliscomenobacteraceae bacterium CHB4]|nr:hypothetical protein [Saprospiraceae bacterium]MCE7926102.1 hypothetical protein [Haliscomenobacteraceae bacterium CHB4]
MSAFNKMLCWAQFVFLLIPVLVFSQKKDTPPAKTQPTAANPAIKDTAIAKLFDKPADIKWVKYFKGRMDDVSVVDIALGSDGKSCKGYLTYGKSRARLRLDGALNGDSLRLQERDGKNLTGNLKGTYKNRRLEADWTNHNNSLGSRLEADEINSGQTLTIGCSDGKWASRYIARFNGARADMILLRMHNGQLYGYLWVEADAKTYDLRGDIRRDGNYEIEALSSNDKIAGLLHGNLANPQKTDCNWVGSGEKRTFNFTLKDNFQLGCYEYADFLSSYDALYPRTPCSGCNTWLDQQVNNWVNKCKSTLAAKKDSPSAANRSSQRASCWAEIACLTENIFSGYLTFSETWNPQASGQGFNFDLRTGKQITFNELFNKSFNARGWLDDFAKKESPKLAHFANDPEYRQWVAKEGFPMFTLRRDGLELSTLFHAQYGRQTLLVPYVSLKPYMKKDNPVADFVK